MQDSSAPDGQYQDEHPADLSPASDRLAPALVGALLLACSLAYLFTAPTNGDFWWSDAPRHGLNGLFLRDLIVQHPLHDPVSWAFAYYARRPALTILFYPPLFYGIEALVFLILGFSHLIAQSIVTAFVFLLGLSAYGIARFYTGRIGAVAAMLLALGMPETALWGRQVMLDVPAYALAAASGWLLLRFIRDSRPIDLYGCAALLLGAIYTKYNAGFVAIPFAIALIGCRGWRVLASRRVLSTGAVSALLLIPALVLMKKFGGANLASVTGVGDMPTPDTLAFWTFYVRVLPEQMGWSMTLLAIPAVIAMVAALARGDRLYLLPLSWLVFGYMFYTLISQKEPRHSLMVLLPIAIAIPALAQRLPWRPVAPALSLLFAAGVFIQAMAFEPVPVISGYRSIADWLSRNAPKDALVVYSGPRDGNLVFDLAQTPAAQDIAVVRADKLLLSVPAGERRRGVGQAPYTQPEIARMLRDLGPDFLIVQPDFWADLKAMADFDSVAGGPDYERIATFHIGGRLSTMDGKGIIEILKPTYTVRHGDRRLDIDMPLLGRRLQSGIGP
jgi:hypothetical protein